jgi:hypothetical protein
VDGDHHSAANNPTTGNTTKTGSNGHGKFLMVPGKHNFNGKSLPGKSIFI